MLYDALAIAGEDGTLAGRMGGTAAQDNARAKTGTLAIAVCLSGYVTSANKHVRRLRVAHGRRPRRLVRAARSPRTHIVVMLAKARLPGRRGARSSPTTRQIPVGSSAAVNPTGGFLEPVVQP